MSRISRRVCLAVAVLAAGRFGTATAQGLIGIAPGAEIGAEYRGNWQRVDGRGQRTGADFTEWLQLPFVGQLLDRRFLEYRLSLRPELRQSSFTGAEEPLRGRQLGLAGSADLFSALPVTLRFTGGRAAGSSRGGVGSESSFRYSSFGVTAAVRNPVFPLQLELARQSSLTDLRPVPSSPAIRTSYTLRSLGLQGSSSKTSLRLSRMDFNDHLTPADYRVLNAGLFHQFRWGKGSRLETGLEGTAQDGILSYERREWSERLHLQHTRSVSSDLTYRLSRTRSDDNPTRLQNMGYQFSTAIVRRLSAGLHVSRSVGESDVSRENVFSLIPRVGADVPAPAGIRLLADLSLGLEKRTRVGSGRALIQVSDERHSVGQTRSFFLDQPDADRSSVIVRDEGRLIVYSAGTDYVLLPLGQELRVDVPPGSRIAVGDRLLVSYTYLAPGASRQRALIASYRVAASRGGVRLEHTRSLRRDGARTSDPVRGVSDFDESRTRLLVRTGTRAVRVDLEGSVERRDRQEIERTEYSLGADASLTPLPTVVTALGLHWNRSQADGERVDATSARMVATWAARRGLQLQAALDALLWQQRGTPDDRFLGATLDALWQVFALEATLRYEYSRRTGPYTLTGHRVSTRLIRRF